MNKIFMLTLYIVIATYAAIAHSFILSLLYNNIPFHKICNFFFIINYSIFALIFYFQIKFDPNNFYKQ